MGNELMHHVWFMKTKELVRPGKDMGKHACFFLSSFPICTQPTVFAYVLSAISCSKPASLQLYQGSQTYGQKPFSQHFAHSFSAFAFFFLHRVASWSAGTLHPCSHKENAPRVPRRLVRLVIFTLHFLLALLSLRLGRFLASSLLLLCQRWLPRPQSSLHKCSGGRIFLGAESTSLAVWEQH